MNWQTIVAAIFVQRGSSCFPIFPPGISRASWSSRNYWNSVGQWTTMNYIGYWWVIDGLLMGYWVIDGLFYYLSSSGLSNLWHLLRHAEPWYQLHDFHAMSLDKEVEELNHQIQPPCLVKQFPCLLTFAGAVLNLAPLEETLWGLHCCWIPISCDAGSVKSCCKPHHRRTWRNPLRHCPISNTASFATPGSHLVSASAGHTWAIDEASEVLDDFRRTCRSEAPEHLAAVVGQLQDVTLSKTPWSPEHRYRMGQDGSPNLGHLSSFKKDQPVAGFLEVIHLHVYAVWLLDTIIVHKLWNWESQWKPFVIINNINKNK